MNGARVSRGLDVVRDQHWVLLHVIQLIRIVGVTFIRLIRIVGVTSVSSEAISGIASGHQSMVQRLQMSVRCFEWLPKASLDEADRDHLAAILA